MRVSYFFILFLISSLGFSEASVSVFDRLLTSKSDSVRAHACNKASQYQYVFVAGIFNELMPYYFKDYQDWLLRCRVPQKNILIARPYSGAGLNRSSSTLKELLSQMTLQSHDKPLIIVGHSKGAPEALLAAIESPPEVQNQIAVIVSIQGSFGGSPIADLALSYAKDEMSSRDRFRVKVGRRLALWLKRVEAAYGGPMTEGVYSVKTQQSRQFWTQYLKDHSSSAILTQNKFLVLQTYKNYRRLNPFFFFSGQYLDRITGERTDGAIPFSAQKPPIPNLQTAVMELDHLDTVLPKAFSFSSAEIRYHLIASIIEAI